MELIPFNPWETVHVTEGNLPHWQQSGRAYFITWRTADSIPAAWLRKLHHERDIWLKAHGICLEQLATLQPERQHEFHQRFTHAWHDKLDECHGACLLRDRRCRDHVAATLRHFDGGCYNLGDFTIMPNHVHLLVLPHEGQDIERLCFSWKRYSAGEINRLLGRQGEFWQVESHDHIVRNTEALAVIQNYMAQNPVKARLSEDEFTLYQPPSWR